LPHDSALAAKFPSAVAKFFLSVRLRSSQSPFVFAKLALSPNSLTAKALRRLKFKKRLDLTLHFKISPPRRPPGVKFTTFYTEPNAARARTTMKSRSIFSRHLF